MQLGFLTPRNKTNRLETIAHVEDLLKKDILSYEQVERAFAPLLQNIREAEGNLKIIVEQMESLKKLANHREDITTRLLAEESLLKKQPTIEGVARGKEYFEMIRRIDSQLRPLMDIIDREIKRLKLSETHELYLEENNREILKKIDKDASLLSIELLAIQKKVNAFESELTHASRKLVEHERLAQLPKKDKIGFV
jgi:hypothetical protein